MGLRGILIIVARGLGGYPRIVPIEVPDGLRSAPYWPIPSPNCRASWPRRFGAEQSRLACGRSGPASLGHGEMLEQRDDIGEGFVKGQHVGIGGLPEEPVQPVEQRMRRLMGDDVVRKAAENGPARKIFAAIPSAGK